MENLKRKSEFSDKLDIQSILVKGKKDGRRQIWELEREILEMEVSMLKDGIHDGILRVHALEAGQEQREQLLLLKSDLFKLGRLQERLGHDFCEFQGALALVETMIEIIDNTVSDVGTLTTGGFLYGGKVSKEDTKEEEHEPDSNDSVNSEEKGDKPDQHVPSEFLMQPTSQGENISTRCQPSSCYLTESCSVPFNFTLYNAL